MYIPLQVLLPFNLKFEACNDYMFDLLKSSKHYGPNIRRFFDEYQRVHVTTCSLKSALSTLSLAYNIEKERLRK